MQANFLGVDETTMLRCVCLYELQQLHRSPGIAQTVCRLLAGSDGP